MSKSSKAERKDSGDMTDVRGISAHTGLPMALFNMDRRNSINGLGIPFKKKGALIYYSKKDVDAFLSDYKCSKIRTHDEFKKVHKRIYDIYHIINEYNVEIDKKINNFDKLKYELDNNIKYRIDKIEELLDNIKTLILAVVLVCLLGVVIVNCF